MDIIIISFISIFVYFAASLLQGLAMGGYFRRAKPWVLLLGLIAVCLHGLLLHEWIDITAGQNLNFLNLFSLAAWLVSVLVLVVVMIKPVDAIVLFSFPVATISILLVLIFPQQLIVQTASQPDTLFHILLGVLTFCVMCLAGLLALLLAIQERLLRYKKLMVVVTRLPALESMETLLFQVISLGFVLLSVLVVTSVYFYHAILFQHAVMIQKTISMIAAWVVFAVLLVGRYLRGWRGGKAIYYTLAGVVLLLFAYYGSKMVLVRLLPW